MSSPSARVALIRALADSSVSEHDALALWDQHDAPDQWRFESLRRFGRSFGFWQAR
jgi:hypothetical protein